jgi:hypothetical protein
MRRTCYSAAYLGPSGLSVSGGRLGAGVPHFSRALNLSPADTTVRIGQTWAGQSFDQLLEGARCTLLCD